jgi:hypothetical protein
MLKSLSIAASTFPPVAFKASKLVSLLLNPIASICSSWVLYFSSKLVLLPPDVLLEVFWFPPNPPKELKRFSSNPCPEGINYMTCHLPPIICCMLAMKSGSENGLLLEPPELLEELLFWSKNSLHIGKKYLSRRNHLLRAC